MGVELTHELTGQVRFYDSGAGISDAQRFTYRGLRGHAQGGGLAGFASRTIHDPHNSICTQIDYQAPIWSQREAGLVSGITKRYGSSVSTPGSCNAGIQLINRAQNTWSTRSQYIGVFETFLTNKIEQSWDLGGEALPSVTTATLLHEFDTFGNPLRIAVSTSDGFSKTTTNTYTNNPASWILGRLTRATVTSSTPWGSDTRVSAFEYRPADGLLSAEIVEPNQSGTSQYLRTDYGYDAYGNKQTVTVNGSGLRVDRRRSTTLWPGGRFPTSTTNALGHTETRSYDARFGTVTSITDPNNLTATLSYDKLGRKFCETRADGSKSATQWMIGGGYAYHVVSKDSAITAADNVASRIHFDLLNRERLREARSFDGSFAQLTTVFDERGHWICRVANPPRQSECGLLLRRIACTCCRCSVIQRLLSP